MKRVTQTMFLISVSLLILLTGTGCSERIKVGEAGLKVNLYGDKKGVDNVQYVTGRVWYNPFTTEVETIQTSVQRVIFTQATNEGDPYSDGIVFMSKGGLKVIGDFAVEYQVNQEQLKHFYVKYKSRIGEQGLRDFSRSIIRDRLRTIARASL